MAKNISRGWAIDMNSIEKVIGKNKYHCHISGHGEPLVLLHGFTGSTETWLPLMEKWSSAFKVIAIDLPGHGQSKIAQFPSMTGFCDELKEILDALEVDRCHLLGYSMGGRIALSFALRHPNYVSHLILESASPGLKTIEERLTRQTADGRLGDKILRQGIEAFVNKWEKMPLFDSQKTLPKEVLERQRSERLSQDANGLKLSLQHMGTGAQPSWWEQLKSLSIPTQLIVGELDHKFVKINRDMEKQIKWSELIIVQDAGHAVHLEQVEKFATIVMEFIYFKKI